MAYCRYSDEFENGEIDVATSLYGLSVLEGRRKNYDKVCIEIFGHHITPSILVLPHLD